MPSVMSWNKIVHTALASGAAGYSSRELARDGYVVVPEFLSPGDAAAAREDLSRLADRSVRDTGVAGARIRDRADRQRIDLNVRQVVGADLLSPVLAELHADGRIVRTMSELTGLDLACRALTVQIDWPDTATKRGLHVDSHWPPTWKCFVYLTPVESSARGPFSVVPGSHAHRLRKLRAVAGNAVHHRKLTDVDHTYHLTEARCLLGPPGTAIFADQRLAHAGWPGHTEGTRLMVVAYLYRRSDPWPKFLR